MQYIDRFVSKPNSPPIHTSGGMSLLYPPRMEDIITGLYYSDFYIQNYPRPLFFIRIT